MEEKNLPRERRELITQSAGTGRSQHANQHGGTKSQNPSLVLPVAGAHTDQRSPKPPKPLPPPSSGRLVFPTPPLAFCRSANKESLSRHSH